MSNLTDKLIEVLPNGLKKASIILLISLSTLSCVPTRINKGLDSKHKLEDYCRVQKNVKSGGNYKNIELTDYCKIKPDKNISSNKYTPQYYSRKNQNYCVSKAAKRYERNLKKLRRKGR